MSARYFLLASFLAVSACSPGASSVAPAIGNGTGGTPFLTTGNGGASPGGAPVTPGGSCTPGTTSCYCPDGTASGTQTCYAPGKLSVCDCPMHALTVQPTSSET